MVDAQEKKLLERQKIK